VNGAGRGGAYGGPRANQCGGPAGRSPPAFELTPTWNLAASSTYQELIGYQLGGGHVFFQKDPG